MFKFLTKIADINVTPSAKGCFGDSTQEDIADRAITNASSSQIVVTPALTMEDDGIEIMASLHPPAPLHSTLPPTGKPPRQVKAATTSKATTKGTSSGMCCMYEGIKFAA